MLPLQKSNTIFFFLGFTSLDELRPHLIASSICFYPLRFFFTSSIKPEKQYNSRSCLKKFLQNHQWTDMSLVYIIEKFASEYLIQNTIVIDGQRVNTQSCFILQKSDTIFFLLGFTALDELLLPRLYGLE